MKATITKLGILAHQICYEVKWVDGTVTWTKTFKTLRAAKAWAAKMDAATACTRDTEYDDGSCRCSACQDRAIDQAHSGPPQDEGDGPK